MISAAVCLCVLAQPGAAPTPHAAPAATAPAATQAAGPYHVTKTFTLGGDGGWDCIEVDPGAGRLYVSRGTRVMVADAQSGKLIGEVESTSGVHDVALAPKLGKGFTSNGKTGDVSVFDLATLRVTATVPAGKNPDAIVFEPVTQRVFCFNAKGDDVTVINAADNTVLGTIALGGNPELTAIDGAGHVFVNIENTSEVLELDAKGMSVAKRVSLAPGEEPTGLAYDGATKHLFAACHNQKMAVVDLDAGKVVATPAIGSGVDGAGFDITGKFAISSNGEGTITVIGTTGDNHFEVLQTLPTARGARTMAIDQHTREIFLPTAEFEAQKQGEKGRPKMKPGTFKIVVVGAS
jgi:YVTN family beta-propeller protein